MREPGRRLKFAILVLVSQLLLIGLAVAWVIHMILIAVNGAVYFVEAAPLVLWAEILATAMISLFAVVVFIVQVRRLSERRKTDRGLGGREVKNL
jgi:membrane protein implicated in regulation of membrane protease activity